MQPCSHNLHHLPGRIAWAVPRAEDIRAHASVAITRWTQYNDSQPPATQQRACLPVYESQPLGRLISPEPIVKALHGFELSHSRRIEASLGAWEGI